MTKACLLDQDVQKLSDKWQTEIVDRGANLSVELRTRIAIARAVYSNLDILLVDDVLANLDKSTAEHIYQKVFKGLLKSKTVILTTSQRRIADMGENMLSMKNDTPCQMGSKSSMQIQLQLYDH